MTKLSYSEALNDIVHSQDYKSMQYKGSIANEMGWKPNKQQLDLFITGYEKNPEHIKTSPIQAGIDHMIKTDVDNIQDEYFPDWEKNAYRKLFNDNLLSGDYLSAISQITPYYNNIAPAQSNIPVIPHEFNSNPLDQYLVPSDQILYDYYSGLDSSLQKKGITLRSSYSAPFLSNDYVPVTGTKLPYQEYFEYGMNPHAAKIVTNILPKIDSLYSNNLFHEKAPSFERFKGKLPKSFRNGFGVSNYDEPPLSLAGIELSQGTMNDTLKEHFNVDKILTNLSHPDVKGPLSIHHNDFYDYTYAYRDASYLDKYKQKMGNTIDNIEDTVQKSSPELSKNEIFNNDPAISYIKSWTIPVVNTLQEYKSLEPSLTDKLVRDDLQLDAINHPNDRNAIDNFFEKGSMKGSYFDVMKELENGVKTGNMTFTQMSDLLEHDKDFNQVSPHANLWKEINENQLIERDSQESLELAHQIDPNFKPENTKQLETNLSQGDLSRSGLENEVHLEETVGHSIPLKYVQIEGAPDPFSMAEFSKQDQKVMNDYTNAQFKTVNSIKSRIAKMKHINDQQVSHDIHHINDQHHDL